MDYIVEQITKAERQGWFDNANYTNFCRCVDLLKEIRNYANKQQDGMYPLEEVR